MSVPKVLTVGLLTPVPTLDPRRPSLEALQVLRQILEPPFDAVPGTSEVVPVLFSGPLEQVPGAGEQACRGRLRSDLRFSDGQPLTAEEVAVTLRGAPSVLRWADAQAQGQDIVFSISARTAGLRSP